MFKKLLSTSVLNAMTAGINILSSFVIVRVLSLEIFGEFAIFNAVLAFGGLIYAIIPSNFSIFKLQDDKHYKKILLSFFFLCSILFSIFVAILSIFGVFKIDFLTVYFFGVTTFSLGYFDIKFQALGKLSKYFSMLFFVAFLKIITLGLFYYAGHLNSLTDLLWTMTIVQLIVLFIFLLEDKSEIADLSRDFKYIKKTITFIKENISIFKPYYLNTFLKRLRENVIILLFSKFTSKDIIGLFSIFIKVASFVFGLSRNLEAFFMNRQNIDLYRRKFYQKILYFAILLQIIFLITGLTYLKLFINEYFFIEILILSFLVYPHVYFLLARSELLSKYQNREVNIGEIFYILIVFAGVAICYSFNLSSIYGILTTYGLATLGLQLFLIFSLTRINRRY